MTRGVSERCITLVKEFEGFGDTRRYGASDPRRGDPYRCPAGVWTQGYGRTRGITEHSPRITEPEALAWLVEDVAEYARGVAAVLRQPATQNQFDAMVSLAYNIGLEAFGRSTVLRKFNADDDTGAAEAFRMWNRAGGQVSRGLVRRRAREIALFTEGMQAAAMPQAVDEPIEATPDTNRGPIANLAAQVAAAIVALAGVAEPFRNALDTVGLGPWTPYIALACAGVGIGLAGVWLYRRIKSRQAVAP